MHIQGLRKILIITKRWRLTIRLHVSILRVVYFREIKYRYILMFNVAEDIHESHIESFIHIGTLLLARAAKQVGMTAGHEDEEDEVEGNHQNNHQGGQQDDPGHS